MAEEDEVLEDDALEETSEDAGEEEGGDTDVADEMEALEEAVSGGDEDEAGEDGDLDPLAEEMLRMMEDETEDGDEMSSQEDVERMMEAEMLKAMEEEGGAGAGAGGDAGGAMVAGAGVSPNVARLMDVNLMVSIELGRTRKTLEDVTDMGEQSLVELDKQVGDPVDILVNGRLFARGEVVTVSENFGVRVTELVTPVNQL